MISGWSECSELNGLPGDARVIAKQSVAMTKSVRIPATARRRMNEPTSVVQPRTLVRLEDRRRDVVRGLLPLLGDLFDERLPVDRERQGLPHPLVLERSGGDV